MSHLTYTLYRSLIVIEFGGNRYIEEPPKQLYCVVYHYLGF